MQLGQAHALAMEELIIGYVIKIYMMNLKDLLPKVLDLFTDEELAQPFQKTKYDSVKKELRKLGLEDTVIYYTSEIKKEWSKIIVEKGHTKIYEVDFVSKHYSNCRIDILNKDINGDLSVRKDIIDEFLASND